MSTVSHRWSRKRLFETVGILFGLTLTVGVLSYWAYLAEESWRDEQAKTLDAAFDVVDTAPVETRGARLDAAAPSSPSGPFQAIPDSAFEMAAKIDGGAKTVNGRLQFDLTRDGKYLKVPMSALASFPYERHPPGAAKLGLPAPENVIPEEILALDGSDALLLGFIVPIDVDKEGIKEFALSQNQAFCCFGVTPALNEMVLVQMSKGKRAPYSLDRPIAVFGKLSVGEEKQDGYVVSLYRMRADEIMSMEELIAYAKSAS